MKTRPPNHPQARDTPKTRKRARIPRIRSNVICLTKHVTNSMGQQQIVEQNVNLLNKMGLRTIILFNKLCILLNKMNVEQNETNEFVEQHM